MHKATALVPLALLSAAWTASLAGVNAPARRRPGERPDPTLPDGTSVPTQAIEAPASVSDGSLLAVGVGDADAAQIVATASTSGIPSAALAAYQRAETVINAADKTCNLTWQLIAAIGRVESNHGRANGNTLDDNGLATPGIYGIALNGANSTTEILDTDAGQFDNDTTYDRAVGPMQFIPSTWSVVGVDADGDGVRNPQDIDDAALGTAVYLCSGADDLGTDAGRRAAVYRYNHSQSYVDLVLAIMDAYLAGRLHLGPQRHRDGRRAHQDPAAAARARHAGPARRAHHEPPHHRATTPSTRRPPTVERRHGRRHHRRPPRRRHHRRRHHRRRQRRRQRRRRPRPGHPRLDPAAPDDQRPAGRPGADPGAGDAQCTLDGINQLLQPRRSRPASTTT